MDLFPGTQADANPGPDSAPLSQWVLNKCPRGLVWELEATLGLGGASNLLGTLGLVSPRATREMWPRENHLRGLALFWLMKRSLGH